MQNKEVKPILVVSYPNDYTKALQKEFMECLCRSTIKDDYYILFKESHNEYADFSLLTIKDAKETDIKQIENLIKQFNEKVIGSH